MLLQSATASFMTKCDSYFITRRDKGYYKLLQVLQSVTVLLQSAKGVTKCDRKKQEKLNKICSGPRV